MDCTKEKAATAFFFAEIAEENLTLLAAKIEQELSSSNVSTVNAALSLQITLYRARDVIRQGRKSAFGEIA